nr:fasciclin domain-containing protein [Saprospiraceae bacterium]
MTKIFYTFLIALLFSATTYGQTVMDVISTSPDHTTLTEALEASGLDATLQGEGPFTVFAPTDEAFDQIDSSLLADLLAEPEGLLTDILLYHVVGDSLVSSDLTDSMTIETLNGNTVLVTIDSNGIFINHAQVTLADLEADNGVVHVIDVVLMPPPAPVVTVADIISGSVDHTTLTDALIAADLLDTLADEEAEYTVFAPTDDAFDAIDSVVLADLFADPEGQLTEILLYHVAGMELFSSDLTDSMTIETLNGHTVLVTIDSNGIFINDAQVTLADLEADNGVVHVIDVVLMPPPATVITVADIISGSPDHATLTDALIAADLLDVLADEEAEYTVFAPTDDAFAAIDSSVLADLLADPEGQLTEILLYHVAGMELFSSDLTDSMTIETLNGNTVLVTIDSNGIFINDAQVTLADLEADNGVVHVIDVVLMPPPSPVVTVADIISTSPDHTTLTDALIAAGLLDVLSDEEATYTVFAPTDDAFAALPPGLLDELLDDPEGLLTLVLLYHVATDIYLSGDLEDGQLIETALGESVTVSIQNGDIFINDALITVSDLNADNGVVHVIDAVLIPEFGPCVEFLGGPWDNFNSDFGGAPVPDASGVCPTFQITAFEVWASEIYVVENFQEGVEYTFSICEGPGAGSWDAELTIFNEDLELVAINEGCEITWTAEYTGTYFIGINEVDACGEESDNLSTDNGYPTLTCTGVELPETVWDIIRESEDHNTLEVAILEADLVGTLVSEGLWTVFAPTDDAFDALPDGLLDELLDDPEGDLTEVLLYHVLSGTFLAGDLNNGMIVTTVLGQDVEVTIENGNIFINDAQVIVSDIMAENGVVHVIDAVLMPDLTSVRDYSEVSVNLFPNPVSSTLFVEIPEEMKGSEITVEIMSIDGRIIQQLKVSGVSENIDVNEFPTGTYIITLSTDRYIAKDKFIKK